MKLMLAVTLMLMLASAASAAVENKQTGPYAVSLNMNTDMKYQVQVLQPVTTPVATSYSMLIFTDNNTRAGVSVTEYKTPSDATLSMYKNLAGLSMTVRGVNVTAIDDKVIDGKKGFVASGEPFPGVNAPAGMKFYQATYWLDSKDLENGAVSVGTTRVDITSSYPQDVTMNLVDSIKVTKSG